MVDFFIKIKHGQAGQPATFQRFIMEHDIRHLAQDAGVSWIASENAIDVICGSPYEELAVDVQKKLFDLETLKAAMEEIKDDFGRCGVHQLRKRAIELQQSQQTDTVLTGWELS